MSADGDVRKILTTGTLIAVVLAAALSASAEERWIIPVYGSGVKGLGFTYDSILAIGNPTSNAANVRVSEIFPITAAPYPYSVFQKTTVPIPPHGTFRLAAGTPLSAGGDALLLGAAVITADQPLELRSEVVGTAPGPLANHRWQTVEIARDWLVGPSRIDRAMRGDGDTTNLFLINPNAFPIDIEYSSEAGGFGRATVAPHSSTLRILGPEWWCPRGCAWIAIIDLGRGVAITLNASSPYLAAATNPSALLAPVVRIPYALK